MKVALPIGHSRIISGRRDGGAVAADRKTNEWTFNKKVASILAEKLLRVGHQVKVWDHYEGVGYTKATLWVAEQIKNWGANIAIELHFNYHDGKNNDQGHGHEWLYWHTSVKGRKLSEFLSNAEKTVIPSVVARSLLPRKSGRGAVFLESTHCPAVVGEPFFGDDDWDKVTPELVAEVYFQGIVDYAKFYGL
jgi:N-acetylmuramoyl-L-alanine amidase